MANTRLLAAILCLFTVTTALADESSQQLKKAIDTWDAQALQATADGSSEINQQKLARGVLEAFAGKDAAAIAALETLVNSRQLDDVLQFVAFKELGMLHLRGQQYERAATAFESALRLSANIPTDEREDLEDTLRYARAHAGTPPMTVAIKSRASSPVIRDSMDLPRVSARINGHPVDVIMDTGASHSVVSQSTARRLHLRILRFDGGVAASGSPVSAQFAIADTLLFAGYELRHVPFIVLPDEAVSVPLGPGEVGKLEPMVGLSVLRRLGRLEIIQRDGKESLRAGGQSATRLASNLLLPEGLPVVLVHVDSEDAQLRMSLDTGANRTGLAPAALTALPALANRATQGRVATADAARVSSNDAGTIIPQLTVRVADAAIPLSRVPVAPGPAYCEGTLGQDVFRSGGGYVIDFDRMTLEILPASTPNH